MKLLIGHAPNGDIGGSGYWTPPTDPGTARLVAVDSIEDAARISRDFIERNELGGGNWATFGLLYQDGALIGQIAYNGRFFNRDHIAATTPLLADYYGTATQALNRHERRAQQ